MPPKAAAEKQPIARPSIVPDGPAYIWTWYPRGSYNAPVSFQKMSEADIDDYFTRCSDDVDKSEPFWDFRIHAAIDQEGTAAAVLRSEGSSPEICPFRAFCLSATTAEEKEDDQRIIYSLLTMNIHDPTRYLRFGAAIMSSILNGYRLRLRLLERVTASGVPIKLGRGLSSVSSTLIPTKGVSLATQHTASLLAHCCLTEPYPNDIVFTFDIAMAEPLKLYANSTILSQKSSYFRAMLSFDGAQSARPDRDAASSAEQQLVPITAHSYTTYKTLLHYLYTGEAVICATTASMSGYSGLMDARPDATELYKLAHEMDMPELQHHALREIIARMTPENGRAQLFSEFATTYKDVQEAMLKWVAENWQTVSSK